MELNSWLSLLAVCVIGAISPGPSIALIIDISARRGHQHGMIAAVAHGIGVGFYAILAAAGVAVVIQQSATLFTALQLLGAFFLAFLGCRALGLNKLPRPLFRSQPQPRGTATSNTASSSFSPLRQPNSYRSSFTTGLLTALFNPKVALFFIALFSQFVSPMAGLAEKAIMAGTATLTDTLWFVLVAAISSNHRISSPLAGYGQWLQKAFGVLLLLIALRIVISQ